MKKRTIIGVLCIILALVICFIVAPLVNKSTESKTEIARLTKDIAQGTAITENDIIMVTVGSYNLPDDVIKDKTAIIGKYAACDLKTNDYILPSKISAISNDAEDVFKALDGKQQAISIAITTYAAGLSGKLQNGDIISVIVTLDGKAIIPQELKYVKVVTTTTSDGKDANKTDTSNEQQPSTVTLLVNELQATLLTEYEGKGKIRISLIYRGDEENANKYLEKQNDILNIITNKESSKDNNDVSKETSKKSEDISNG